MGARPHVAELDGEVTDAERITQLDSIPAATVLTVRDSTATAAPAPATETPQP